VPADRKNGTQAEDPPRKRRGFQRCGCVYKCSQLNRLLFGAIDFVRSTSHFIQKYLKDCVNKIQRSSRLISVTRVKQLDDRFCK